MDPRRPYLRNTITLVAFLLSLPITLAQYNSRNLTPAVEAEAGQQYTCEKLRLIPILANETFRAANKDIGKTIPMNKALTDGRLRIQEHAGGATVNTLQAINTSKDTIYLMQGEVVTGGQQDRMMAQDVLVPPGATMDIGAFCVEHGRWSENGDGQQFKSTVGVVSQDVRKVAAIEKEQGLVWDRVALNVSKAKARSSTGSYAHMVDDQQFQEQRNAYREMLKDMPANFKGIVGVIAVSGDRIVGCDVFANEAMFTQAFPQLIDAYITEALHKGGPVTMSDAAVQTYFSKLFSEEDKLEERSNGNGYLFKSKGRTYRVSMF